MGSEVSTADHRREEGGAGYRLRALKNVSLKLVRRSACATRPKWQWKEHAAADHRRHAATVQRAGRCFSRVTALLELGSGFNPEFTGRDNIYLNAAILGYRKRLQMRNLKK